LIREVIREMEQRYGVLDAFPLTAKLLEADLLLEKQLRGVVVMQFTMTTKEPK
jgi:hypothetical protein